MRYRIQFLVDAARLPAVIEAAYGGALDYDPELKIWPATRVLPGDIVGIERPVPTPKEMLKAKRAGNNKGNKRAELVEAALKEGPKRWSELRAVLAAGGLSESSLNNFISQWQKAGKISRSADGLWSLNNGATQAAHAG
jgi:hypothetical protein